MSKATPTPVAAVLHDGRDPRQIGAALEHRLRRGCLGSLADDTDPAVQETAIMSAETPGATPVTSVCRLHLRLSVAGEKRPVIPRIGT